MKKEFLEKVIKAQEEIKAPKNKPNTFGGYKYRSAEQILEAAKPILRELGLMLNLSDEVTSVEGWHFVKSTATLTDGEESLVSIGYAREEETLKGMTKGQITGSCSSFARKYALNGLFLIDESEADFDSDTVQNTMKQAEELEKQPVGKPEIKALQDACKEKNIPLKEVLDSAKVNTAEELKVFEWSSLMKRIEISPKRDGKK